MGAHLLQAQATRRAAFPRDQAWLSSAEIHPAAIAATFVDSRKTSATCGLREPNTHVRRTSASAVSLPFVGSGLLTPQEERNDKIRKQEQVPC